MVKRSSKPLKTIQMKYFTINLGENKIEIHNSIFGNETIKVNDKIVSDKFSIFGANHKFKIIENEREVECKINIGLSFQGVVFNLYKDEKPIVIYNKNTLRGILTIIFLVLLFKYDFFFN